MLVVDDLPEICRFFSEATRRLTQLDVDLVTEVNATRALDLVTREPFDVVVSDYRMRPADGLTVLARARETNPECRRILVTGYDEIPASAERFRDAGVDIYLRKPFDLEHVMGILHIAVTNDAAHLEPLREAARELESAATDGAATRVE